LAQAQLGLLAAIISIEAAFFCFSGRRLVEVSGGAQKLKKVVNLTIITTTLFAIIAFLLILIAAGTLGGNPSACFFFLTLFPCFIKIFFYK